MTLGTAEWFAHAFPQPSLRDLCVGATLNPAINRWAILTSPYGAEESSPRANKSSPPGQLSHAWVPLL